MGGIACGCTLTCNANTKLGWSTLIFRVVGQNPDILVWMQWPPQKKNYKNKKLKYLLITLWLPIIIKIKINQEESLE